MNSPPTQYPTATVCNTTTLAYKAGYAVVSPTGAVSAMQVTEAVFSTVVTPGMAPASVHRPLGWSVLGSGLSRLHANASLFATPYSTSRSAAAHGQDASRGVPLVRHSSHAGRMQALGGTTPSTGGKSSDDVDADIARAVLGSPDPAPTKVR